MLNNLIIHCYFPDVTPKFMGQMNHLDWQEKNRWNDIPKWSMVTGAKHTLCVAVKLCLVLVGAMNIQNLTCVVITPKVTLLVNYRTKAPLCV